MENVDYILHAGDWNTLEVYEELSQLAPVDGVAGNTDGFEIVQDLVIKKCLSLDPRKLALSMVMVCVGRRWIMHSVAFKDEEVDCIIFGHSHIPLIRMDNGILLLNPGSPTDKRGQPQYSYAILEILERASFLRSKTYILQSI